MLVSLSVGMKDPSSRSSGVAGVAISPPGGDLIVDVENIEMDRLGS